MPQKIQKKLAPMFIVSSGRAGTNLLRAMLNANTQIYILHESFFISMAYSFYYKKQSYPEENYQFFIKTTQDSGWKMPAYYLLSSFLEVRYKDLLSIPEKEIKKVGEFLALNYDPPRHENYGESKRNENTILEKDKNTISSKVKQTINQKKPKKYLSQMTKLEKFVFELIALRYKEKYGYEAEYPILKTPLLKPLRSLSYWAVP